MNLQQLMKQAQQMQEQLQKQMETTVVEASAGGGMVSVKMNGNKQLLSIAIDPEVFTGGDKEMLQDLVVAAVNEGIRKVDEALAGQLGNMTGGMKIPRRVYDMDLAEPGTRLVAQFKKLPATGTKSAQAPAFFILQMATADAA